MKISKYIIRATIALFWVAAFPGCQDMGHDIPYDYPPEQDDNLRPNPPVYNSLKLYMAFDDNLNNASNYDMVITPTGTMTYAEGNVNNALQCGAGKYILVAPSETVYKGGIEFADTLANLGGFSFVTWLYFPSSAADGAQELFAISNTAKEWSNLDVFVDGSTKIKVHVYNYKTAGTPTDAWVDVDYAAAGSPIVDRWLQYAVTYDPATSTFKTYINGVEKSSAVSDGFGPIKFENVGPMVIGNFQQNASLGVPPLGNWAKPYAGKLDQLRFYNKPLTGSEVGALYNAEKSDIPDYSPLKMWLKFDDNIFDASNYSIPMSSLGTLVYPAGQQGRSLQFGNNIYVVATPSSGTKFNLADTLANMGSMTISTWMYFDSSDADGAQEVITLVNNTFEWDNVNLFCDWGGGLIKANINNFRTGANKQMWVQHEMDVKDQWLHVALRYDEKTSTANLFVNGQLQVKATNTIADYGALRFDNNGPILVGAFPRNTTPPIKTMDWGWAVPFKGKLDNVRLYNKALTDQQILDQYNAEK